MKYIFLFVTLVFSLVTQAESKVEPTQYKCMTEYDASLYYDKFLEGYLKSNWIGGIFLEAELEKCIEAGSYFASYELGNWKYFMSTQSKKKSEGFQKNNEFEISKRFGNMAHEDGVKAIMYLEQSAKYGYLYSLYKLGEIYRDGLTVPKSKIFAATYFISAGFAAFKAGSDLMGIKAYENAMNLDPNHPDLPQLKKLVYK